MTRFTPFVLLLAVLIMVAGCVAPAPAAEMPEEEMMEQVSTGGVTLPEDAAASDKQVFRSAGIEGKHFDTMRNEYEGFAFEATIEQLAKMGPEGEWHPAAADSWEVSDDGRTWTFHLRQDAMWSDGTPVTAEDWVYSFRRYLNPEMANVYAWFLFDLENGEAYNKGEVDVEELGVELIDEYTFSLTTSVPIPYYMFKINWHAAPVPRHMVEEHGDDWANDPATAPSNGPYRIAEWNRGQNVIFTPNPYYTGRYPATFEQKIQVIIPEVGAPLLQMYQAGDIDGGVGVTGDDLVQVLADPQLSQEAYISVMNRGVYLYLNQRTPPFDDILVRQALGHAVDRTALCDNVMRGTCIPAHGFLPKDFPCERNDDPELIAYQNYDPEKAADLLAQAGYPGGEGFPEMVLYTKEGEFIREAEAIQRMLADNLGIKLTPQNIERADYVARMANAELKIALNRWGADFIDPSNFVDWWDDPAASYFTGWTDEEYRNLIDTARPMQMSAERCDLYHEAIKILARDAIGVFVMNPVQAVLYKDYVSGLTLTDDGTLGVYNMMLLDSAYITE
ncbi:MAG: peptide ABC transporter substrate-binding protein [Caldilineaceae bacterium]|nr:peptide ABC transporter substrate-binding protein [Caldilineaceae bacterium]MCY4118247.1 peptide ABC transporter substrate-binding protein [Caldilineaceae bacterium]MDE0183279.1 peptide ABC transporter substrate-binding protein [Caldilineaceae bacterium]MDE0428551.1 peptide ABC transporter substrate-binding protein [Caldilineaceae bacterium]